MAFGRPNPRDTAREQQARQWLQRQNGFAVASLVLGVFSFIELGTIPLFSAAAIGLGVVGIRQLKAPTGPRTQGRRLAVIGLVLGAISLCIGLTLYSMHRWR
jgi:hypothetical protein